MSKINDLLKQWRKELYKQPYLEEGMITELEDHLLNVVKSLQQKGHDEEEAFKLAVEKMGDITVVSENEHYSQRRIESNHAALLRSIFKVARRYFRKNSLISAINVIGLILAFTSIIFISLFVYDELSFEKDHPDYEQIHRLSYTRQMEDGSVEDRAFSSGMWVDLLKERYAGATETFRFVNISYGYIQNPANNQSFYTEKVYWSDPNFFDFLNFELKYGKKEDQLGLNSITLSEKTAKQIFGKENPIGEELKFVRRGNEVSLVVTGVIYDPPSNSQFQPDYVANLQAIQIIYGDENRGWIDKNPNPGYIYSYIKVKDEEQLSQVSRELANIWDEMIPERATDMTPLLTPIRKIHYQKPMRWEIDTPINMNVIYGLFMIGVFILVIVLTNFTNLVTAQASKRQKEIGLRKTLGSTVRQLRIQFFIESVTLVFIAIITSIAIVYLFVPGFNVLLGKNISYHKILLSKDYIIYAVPIIAAIVFYAGMLPALYFTKRVRKTINVNDFFIKEKVNSPARNLLVVVQFTVAIVLIIGSITVFQQLELINNGSLGRGRNTVLGIRTSRMGDAQQSQLLKTQLASITGVESNTLGMHLPRQSDFGRIDTKYIDTSGREHFWNKFDADGGFLSTYDIELIAGRDFNRNIEPRALIVNKSAVSALGLTPDGAIGTLLREDSINYIFGASDGVIVGVVKDFAYKSIREVIEPLVICANNEVEGVLSVKLGEGDKSRHIAQIHEVWDDIYPGRPFEYWFLDNEFERMYSQERRLGRLIPLFSILAVVIALLGLFALSLFVAELRKKEIGIRKILGCSSGGILKILSWQYLRTLIPSVIIAVPLAYIMLENWLDSFIYRVDISFATIFISIAGIIAFSLMTVSIKSVRAAKRNPAENLKYE